MKIVDTKKFSLGLLIIALSYIPFSYMNHAEKFTIENSFKVSGKVKKVQPTGKTRQDGWILRLYGVNEKIRITGEYYKAINQSKFKQLIKPDSSIEVYFLKPENYGLFESFNKSLGIIDATAITCSGEEVLSFDNIQNRLSHLFIMNLLFGLTAFGIGIHNIIRSTQNTPNMV